MKAKKTGFTLVEVMVIVSVIGILSSVILVNMNGAKTTSRDKAVFGQITSTQGMAFKCLSANSSYKLKDPAVAGGDICSAGSAYSKWPTFVTESNWSYTVTANFNWCSVSHNSLTTAPSSCSPYSTTCGGNATSRSFCYMFKNGTKTIWCTANGCGKSGF